MTTQQTIERLLALGLPPIPVAPRLDPRANEWAHHKGYVVNRYNPDKPQSVASGGRQAVVGGDYCRISYTNVGGDSAPVKGDCCRLDEHLNPIARFTGKNPSYIDRHGRHRILAHGTFQKRMPTAPELQEWFCDPNTGVGTLGGHGGVDWIDIDRKNFDSQEDCDEFFEELTNRLPGKTWTERTGSGGYRIAVRPSSKPTFTNFAASVGGEHIGEALFEGRYTVLAPSVHPSGNRYQLLSDADPIEIESLEAIGIFPAREEVASRQRSVKRRERKARGFAPQVCDPTDNPWDIRNFARYFEGYHERSDGWGYAKCPHHHGTSQTSFRVKLSTGEYKLWCGCDTKDVWHSGFELAKLMGYEVPQRQRQTNAITREEWTQRFGSKKTESPGRGGSLKELTPEERKAAKKERSERTKQRAKEALESLTRLTYPVSVELNQQFLDGAADLVKWGAINFVSSPCKTGKTTLLGEVVERHRAEYPEGGRVQLQGYRNVLLHQTCHRTGIAHIRSLMTRPEGVAGKWRVNKQLINATRDIALCLDSLDKIELDKIQPHSLVILDEVDAVIKHGLEGGTLGNEQERILCHWQAVINRVLETGGTILGMEDSLTDLPIDFIREITGGRYPTHLIRNSYQASKWNVEVGSGSADGAIAKTLDLVRQGKKVFLASTGQKRGKYIQSILERELPGIKVDRCDRETTEAGAETTQPMHEMMENPDLWIETERPDVLIGSPIMESGLSFWTDHFDEMVVFATNLETRTQIQFIERLRRNEIPRHIFVSEYMESHGGYDPDRIYKDLKRSARQTSRVVGFDPRLLDAIENPTAESDLFNRYAAKYKARQNAATARMAENLIEELRDRGHNVTEIKWEKNEKIRELYKAVKAADEEERADDLDAAPGDLKLREAKDTLKSPEATKGERINAQKSILKADYPGIDMSRDFLLEMVVRRRRAGLKECELEWIVENPKIAAILDRKVMESAIEKPLLMYRRLTHRRLKADLIRSLEGFLDILRSGREIRRTDADVLRFVKILCARQKEVYRVLHLTAHDGIEPLRILSYVADRLGYDFAAIKREGPRGNRQRVYQARERNPEHRQQIKDALTRRYANLVEEESAAVAQTLDAARRSDTVSAKREITQAVYFFADTNTTNPVKTSPDGGSSDPQLLNNAFVAGVARVYDGMTREGRLNLEKLQEDSANLTPEEKKAVYWRVTPETRRAIDALMGRTSPMRA